MQHSSPSSPSRRFTGAISIDQKQARNLAEEAATVNSSSPATTKTSKASPLDAVQEVYDPVSNADSIFQQKAYKVQLIMHHQVKRKSVTALTRTQMLVVITCIFEVRVPAVNVSLCTLFATAPLLKKAVCAGWFQFCEEALLCCPAQQRHWHWRCSQCCC